MTGCLGLTDLDLEMYAETTWKNLVVRGKAIYNKKCRFCPVLDYPALRQFTFPYNGDNLTVLSMQL